MHDIHNDFPLWPQRMAITAPMLCEKPVAVRRNYAIARSSGTSNLIPNVLTNQKNSVHYLNLKFYIKHGMKISKIHRVLNFKQSRSVQQYIEQHQQLRARGNNEF